jgi:hypothetical protein
MRKVKTGLICFAALALLVAGLGQATAGPLWYNGDFDTYNGLSSEKNTIVSAANTYDNFIVGAAGWNVDTVFANELMTANFPKTAHWEIRSGVSVGKGGTLIASGDSAATSVATGRSGFGLNEYHVEVTGLNINLAAGTYWLTVSAIDSGNERAFVSTTSGKNSLGLPAGNDDNSFFDSTFFGVTFGKATDQTGDDPFHPGGKGVDFSMGVGGTVQGVPEPASLTLLGLGIAGMAGYGWRKRKQRVA